MITGGRNGTGISICEMPSADGSNVVVADLKLEDAKAASDQITKIGGNAYSVFCDVTHHADLVK
jgi:NAD(P)-dependent dehydrogenase (short-subunit alcohol dehydrogenase family)